MYVYFSYIYIHTYFFIDWYLSIYIYIFIDFKPQEKSFPNMHIAIQASAWAMVTVTVQPW